MPKTPKEPKPPIPATEMVEELRQIIGAAQLELKRRISHFVFDPGEVLNGGAVADILSDVRAILDAIDDLPPTIEEKKEEADLKKSIADSSTRG
jgi:hypothetical protein